MKFLLTADLHLTSNSNDQYRWEIFPWLDRAAHKRGVDLIFILGDLCEQKDHHSAELVNRLASCLTKLAHNRTVVILKGNHDYNKDPRTPFFGFLGNFPNILFFRSPAIFQHQPRDPAILLLPHSRNPLDDWKGMKLQKHKFVFFHQTISHARASSGRKLAGIPARGFRGRIAISGDVHVPQRIGDVRYVGAPHPVHFGDSFQPRVFYYNGKKLRSIKRNTIYKAVLDNIRGVDDLYLCASSISKNDQVRITVRLHRREFFRWSHIRGEILAYAQRRGWVVRGLQLLEEEEESGDERTPTSSSRKRTADEVFTSFCKSKKLDDSLIAEGRTFL